VPSIAWSGLERLPAGLRKAHGKLVERNAIDELTCASHEEAIRVHQLVVLHG